MLVGLGLDLARIGRFQDALERHGRRFLARCFSDAEVAQALARAKPAAALAMRWAAKEAFAKAAGTGMRGFSFKDIEIVHGPEGQPGIVLHGRALVWAKENGGAIAHVSLTDDGEYAAAVVILEKS